MGLSVPVVAASIPAPAVTLTGITLYDGTGAQVSKNPGGPLVVSANVQAGTYPVDAVASVTKGGVPGGPSFWGGCDTDAPGNATQYGAGGPANATQAGQGGPGCILVLEW